MSHPRLQPDGLWLEKYHGLGNDFLVLLTDEIPTEAAAMAQRLCDRRCGVGADGLIIATADPAVMRLWNSDGSSAEISGNGLRCLAFAIARQRGLQQLEVIVETAVGPRRCLVNSTVAQGSSGSASERSSKTVQSSTQIGATSDLRISNAADQDQRIAHTAEITVEMGSVKVGSAEPKPVSAGLSPVSAGPNLVSAGPSPTQEFPSAAAVVESAVAVVESLCGVRVERTETVDVGNPHIVMAVADPSAIALDIAGPAVEAMFPNGINVHFVAVIDHDMNHDNVERSERSELVLRSWERGSGITAACGSGAVAAAAASSRWGWTYPQVTVRMTGGDAKIDLRPPVSLTGPATYVATIFADSASADSRFAGSGFADSASADSGFADSRFADSS